MVMLGRKIKLIEGIEGDIECYFIECDQQSFSKEWAIEIEPWWKRESDVCRCTEEEHSK